MKYPIPRNPRRRGVALASLCVLLFLGGCDREQQAAAPPPQEVNVLTTVQRAVPLDLRYSARTRGEREVEVRALVSGILLKRYYRQGDVVQPNALLFKIDPEPFEREVERLRGLLAMEKAHLAEASAQRDRVAALFPKGFVSSHDRDLAVAAHAGAEAAAQAAQAALEQAQLNLSYTEVRAPIGGITGIEWRSEGTLVKVGEDSSLLTTIVQTNRMFVDFAMPEPEAQLVRAGLSQGKVTVRVAPDAQGEIAQQAELGFLDTSVNNDSGTVWARATLDNREAHLAPGQFVQARIDGLETAPGIYIPVRAVLRAAEGPMVWVLDAADKAQPRMLEQGQLLGNLVEVRKGLVAGERIIVDGILKVQPGSVVKAVDMQLGELVSDTRSDASAE